MSRQDRLIHSSFSTSANGSTILSVSAYETTDVTKQWELGIEITSGGNCSSGMQYIMGDPYNYTMDDWTQIIEPHGRIGVAIGTSNNRISNRNGVYELIAGSPDGVQASFTVSHEHLAPLLRKVINTVAEQGYKFK